MTAIIERVRGLSRATKTLIAGVAVLALIAASGALRADNDVAISSEEAIAIADDELDFESEQTAVRLVREGIGLEPVWAVSFSVPGTDGQEFENLLVVRIDATNGEILGINRS